MIWDTMPEIHLLDKECFKAVKPYEQSPEEHSRKSKEEGKCNGYRKMSMTSKMSSVLSKLGFLLLNEAVEAECLPGKSLGVSSTITASVRWSASATASRQHSCYCSSELRTSIE